MNLGQDVIDAIICDVVVQNSGCHGDHSEALPRVAVENVIEIRGN